MHFQKEKRTLLYRIMNNIKKIRSKIEKGDKRIIELIKKRFELTGKIAHLKLKEGIKVFDAVREKELHQIYQKIAKKIGISETLVQSIFKAIFSESRKRQQSRKIDDKAEK